jgi:hypothetical protein
MVTFSDKKQQKNSTFFSCVNCDFNTCKKSNYLSHLQSIKHNKHTIGDVGDKKKAQKQPLEKKYICSNCNKIYMSRNGLWSHNKKCNKKNNKIESNGFVSNFSITPNVIMELIKDNKDMKQIILEQNSMITTLIKNGVNNINNINNVNNINSNNKTFNLQLFLNETCKNAMNITDFVNSIQLQLSDLEKVGELGYVEGISKIIINNLKLLDITERPVHCSDMKREVLYVKDDDKWEKEEIENPKIKKAIKCIANKNISLIPEWKQRYPDCNNSNSRNSDIINKIIIESMETNKEKTDKIIKKIVREVGIDKENQGE